MLARERVARYLGMGAQDMVVLGIHGLVEEAVKSRIQDRDYEPLTTMEHVLMMSATFPLIRGIPNALGWGAAGHGSLKQGWKSMMGKYASTDYEALTKNHGKATTKGLLEILTSGGKYNIINQSQLSNRIWKIGEKEYTKSSILSGLKADTMPMDDVYGLLKAYKAEAGKAGTTAWAKGYALDYLGSAPRMIIGAAAMNFELIKSGHMDKMDPRELMTHMFIAGLMTKSRGAWGREAMREYVMDFQGHNEVMDLLNIKHGGITDMIQTYNEGQTTAAFGGAFRSQRAGQQIEKIFSEHSNDQTFLESEFKPEHKIVEDLGRIANIMGMSGHADPRQYKMIEVRRLGRANLDAMKEKLEAIQFSDGTTIGEHGYDGTAARLSKDVAEGVKRIYFNAMVELGEKTGMPITETADGKRLEIGVMNIPMNTNLGEFGTIQSTLAVLRELGLARETISPQKVGFRMNEKGELIRTDIKDQNDPLYNVDLMPIVEGIVDRTTSQLIKENHGKNFNKYVALDGADNPYLKSLIHSVGIDALERIYHMSTKDLDKLDTTEQNFVIASDRALRVKDKWEDLNTVGRILANPNQYKVGRRDLTAKEERVEDTVKEAIDEATNLELVIQQEIHPIIAAAEMQAKDTRTQQTIPFDVARALVEGFEKLDLIRPADAYLASFGRDFPEAVQSYTQQRLLRDWNYSNEALGMVMTAQDRGMLTVDPIQGLQIQSAAAIKEQASKEGLDIDRQNDLARKQVEIIKAIDGPNVHQVPTLFKPDPKTGEQPFYVSDVDKVYNMLDAVFARRVSEQATKVMEFLDTDPQGVELQSNRALLMEGLDIFNRTKDPESLTQIDIALKGLRKYYGGDEKYEPLLKSMEGEVSRFVELRSASDKVLVEGIEGYTMSIGEGINAIATTTEGGRNYIGVIMDKINNLGKFAGTRGEALKYKDMLMDNLTSELGSKENMRKLTLDDAVQEFLKVKTYDALAELMLSVNKKIEMGRSFNVDQAEQMKADAGKFGELYKRSMAHVIIEKDIHVAKKYGLVDPDNINQIDPAWIKDMVDKGIHQSIQRVRDHIYANDKDYTNDNQKKNAWQTFRNEELPVLIKGAFASLGGTRNTARVFGNTIVIQKDVPGRSNKSDDFFNAPGVSGKGYDVFFLEKEGILNDRTETVEGRKDLHNILNGEKPEERKPRVNKEYTEYFEKEGRNLDEFQMAEKIQEYVEGMPANELVPMDLNSGRTVLFHWSADNKAKLNTDFSSWYEVKRQRLTGDVRTNFENSFGHLAELASPGFKDAELKMQLMYTDFTNTSGFNRFLDTRVLFDPALRATWYGKFFKYSKTSEGGNTSRMSYEVLEYMSKHHADRDTKDAFRTIIDRGINLSAVRDEEFVAGNPFYNLGNIRRNIEAISNDPTRSDAERLNAMEFMNELIPELKPSAQSSSIDGGIYIDQTLARVIWALDGKSIGDFNGKKPAVFHNNPEAGTTAILKGFMVYDPDIAGRMGDANMFMGESTAKEFFREGLIPMNFTSSDWRADMVQIGADNIINILPTDIGLGFRGEAGKGVVLSHTLNDFHDVRMTQAVRAWQGLEGLVQEIGGYNTELLGRSNNELARILYDLKTQDGFEFDQGINSLAQKLLHYGMDSNDATIKRAIGKLYRGKMVEILRKPITSKGADAYIIPEAGYVHRNPVIRKISTLDSQGNEIDTGARIYTSFGGMTVGNSYYKKVVTNVKDLDFVYKDNGIDIVIRKDGDQWLVHNVYEEMVRNRGARLSNMDSYDGYDFAARSGVRGVINQIDAYIKDGTIEVTYGDVFNLLNSGVANVRDAKGNRVQKKLQHLREKVKKYDIQLGANAVAIPKKSYDIGFHRVERISNKIMAETASVNAYDLRVLHQRDMDGDKLYTWFGAPFEVMAHNINKMAIVSDYYQMDKVDHDIDPMGFGKSIESGKPRAGTMNQSIGYSELKRLQQTKAMAVGANIGMKNVINWMQNVGFRIGTHVEMRNLNDVAGDYNNSIDKIGTLMRMGNINQSSVDQFGGVNDVLMSNMRNYLLFGDIPDGMTIDPTKHHMNHQSMFSMEYGNQPQRAGTAHQTIDRDIITTVVQALRKPSSIFNDIYDAGGKHTPESWELRKIQKDLRKLFADPNTYVVEKLLWKYRKDPKNRMALVKMFYDAGSHAKDFRLGDQYALGQIMKQIAKGRVPTPTNELIRFSAKAPEKDPTGKKISQEDWLMQLNNSGYLINKLLSTSAFDDQAMYGSLPKDRISSVATFTSQLVERVSFLQGFGQDVFKPIEHLDQAGNLITTDFDLQYKDGLGRGYKGARRMQLEGAVYNLLEHEGSRLARNIRKYSAGGKFMRFDLEMANERFSAVEAAMGLVEKRAMTVVKDVKTITYRVKTAKGYIPKAQRRNLFENKYVYRYKGDVLDKEKLGEIRYDDLDNRIGFVPKGESYLAEPGWTYLEIQRPIIHQSLNHDDSRAGFSLYKATNHVVPENFLGLTQARNFREHTAVVQSEISENYRDVLETMKRAAKSGTAYTNEIFGEGTNRDQWLLDQYFKRWAGEDLMQHADLLNAVQYLIKPRPLQGKFIPTRGEVPGVPEIPYLSVNRRLVSEVMQWLNNNKFMEVNADGTVNETLPGLELMVQNWMKYDKQFKNGKDWEFEDINRSMGSRSLMFMNNYNANLQKLGKDQLSLVGHFLSDISLYDPAMEMMMQEMDLLPGGREMSKFITDGLKTEEIKVELKDRGCKKR